MINLNKNSAIWLVSDEQLNGEFRQAVSLVRQIYRKVHGVSSTTSLAYKVEAVLNCGVDISRWGRLELDALLQVTFRDSEVTLSYVDRTLANTPPSYGTALSQFFRMVFIALWGRRVLIAPLSIQTINHQVECFDMLCEKLDVESLTLIRGLHPESKIASIFKRGEFNDGSSRVNFWLRLLLSTNFYGVDDIQSEDCQKLFDSANGVGVLPLRRYYVNDFLLSVTAACEEKKALVEAIFAQYKISKLVAKPERVRLGRRVSTKVKVKTAAEESVLRSFEVAQQLASGNRDFDFKETFKAHFPSPRIREIFSLGEEGARFPFFEWSHPQVQAFALHIDAVFRSFLKSKRLQKSDGHTFMLGMLMSYLLAYLPNFFMRRDGSLENYPRTLNDFSCSLYFTRESIFLDGVIKYLRAPPHTFLTYVEAFARAHGWTNETHYSRVLIMQHFCEYVEDNRLALPDANESKCTFTSSCFPSIEKKSGTVKRPIPRPYFATFLSMLYSLEYLAEHINLMPFVAGRKEMDINYGVMDGKLLQPSMADLLHSHAWAGLISREVQGMEQVNQSLLNYTPIFYHEKQIYRFDFLPRFYKIVDFEIGGRVLQLVSPNEVRLTQLMCETGLRQHHLAWLNKDKYDCVLDRYWKSPLAPLFVSSDKSHGEWTAIVSRHVIHIMDRQKKWYDSCSSESYKEDLWYGMTEGSKFGQYKPLFRNSGTTDSNWKNNRHFPIFLMILQYFIKIIMEDDSGEDLVFIKTAPNEKTPIAGYDDLSLSKVSVSSLSSPHTPHGLRAGFVTEAMRFLPPSIIGQFMTGQTEELVWYYTIFDDENMPDHQKLLADYMTKNMDKLQGGEAPELAQAVLKLNARLKDSIHQDPIKAIETHGLMSLTGVKEEQNGLEVLRARRYTTLAYNNCHICPFNNHCPKEVVDQLGVGRPCALCPYAIRGVDHLPAVCAEKDKSKEMMRGVLDKLREYQALKPSSRNHQVEETLNSEYDRHAREACALEAIEQQLYKMATDGDVKSLFLTDKKGLTAHYKKIHLSEGEHLLKRLIDVQNFPDVNSARLDQKFAYMRSMMLVRQGKFEELLRVDPRPPSHQLSSQIASMLTAGVLNVRDVVKIGHAAANPSLEAKPVQSMSAKIGVILPEG